MIASPAALDTAGVGDAGPAWRPSSTATSPHCPGCWRWSPVLPHDTLMHQGPGGGHRKPRRNACGFAASRSAPSGWRRRPGARHRRGCREGAHGTGRWLRPRQARRVGPGMCESGLVTRLQVSVQHVENRPPVAGRLARDSPTCYPHPDDPRCRLLRDERHRPANVHARWATPHEVAPGSAGASQGRRRHHEQDPLVGR